MKVFTLIHNSPINRTKEVCSQLFSSCNARDHYFVVLKSSILEIIQFPHCGLNFYVAYTMRDTMADEISCTMTDIR